MAPLNPHFNQLAGGYLFREVEKRVQAFQAQNPHTNTICNFGIGDISDPLTPTLLESLQKGSQEFHGYGPADGYLFLREAISRGDYAGLSIAPDEIFISNGAKCDLANIQELFTSQTRVLITNPAYPVYVDTSIMGGKPIQFVTCSEETHFIPLPPETPSDLIYLCSPNNPTGVAIDRKTLALWVEYAKKHQAVLIFDGAYEAYIRSSDCPRSIYEIPGAKDVAIEIRSFSKTAGFTGMRCSYSVFPKNLGPLHAFWRRRQETKFGGIPFAVQKCAEAVYSPQGQAEVRERINGYLSNAQMLKKELSSHFQVYGGENAPYVWCKSKETSSWNFFEYLLHQTQIVAIPGSGFGTAGEGFLRFSAFAPQHEITEGVSRFGVLNR